MVSESLKAAETAKKKAETAKKLDAAKRKLDRQVDMMEGRIKKGQEVGTKAIDVKYAAKEVKSLQNELNRLK